MVGLFPNNTKLNKVIKTKNNNKYYTVTRNKVTKWYVTQITKWYIIKKKKSQFSLHVIINIKKGKCKYVMNGYR